MLAQDREREQLVKCLFMQTQRQSSVMVWASVAEPLVFADRQMDQFTQMVGIEYFHTQTRFEG